MAKGLFTQGFVVLLEQALEIGDVEPLLQNFVIVKRVEASGNWEFGGPTLVIEYRPEVNGYVSVDVVPRKWPDHMGDPENEATLFGAWGMGHFGPYAYPNGLRRAAQQTWSWEEGKEASARHNAFVRARLSYTFGGAGDAPFMPKDYDPVAELQFLRAVVQSLLKHPSALCYFNPNGELLLTGQMLEDSIRFHDESGILPLDTRMASVIRQGLFSVGFLWGTRQCL